MKKRKMMLGAVIVAVLLASLFLQGCSVSFMGDTYTSKYYDSPREACIAGGITNLDSEIGTVDLGNGYALYLSTTYETRISSAGKEEIRNIGVFLLMHGTDDEGYFYAGDKSEFAPEYLVDPQITESAYFDKFSYEYMLVRKDEYVRPELFDGFGESELTTADGEKYICVYKVK